MRNVFIKELQLCSFKEKKALSLQFKTQKTLILGENDTGKSCVLKSIYHGLGAEAEFEQTWIDAEVKSLVTFEINGTAYSVLRDGSVFSLFDQSLVHQGTFHSVTKDLGPTLGRIFDFKLKLTMSGNGEEQLATPAFMFLPFYIDQDLSWRESFSSFSRLGQFTSWRTPTIEYHTGVRPAAYYELSSRRRLVAEKQREQKAEKKIIANVIQTQKSRYAGTHFDFDIATFKSSIDKMLDELAELKAAEDKYRMQLLNLRGTQSTLKAQIGAAEKGNARKQKDFDFAADIHGSIACPTCATEFENSFADRLSIATDVSELDTLVAELRTTLLEIESEIASGSTALARQSSAVKALERTIEHNKEKILLIDVIRSEGKKELLRDLQAQAIEIDGEVLKMDDELASVKIEMEKFDDSGHRTKINDFYVLQMKDLLRQLEVNNIKEESYSKLANKVRKSGSDQPRAVLAYFFSIVRTIAKFGTSAFFPIVIDSPNQQAQDFKNLSNILGVIPELVPDGRQLILGLESQHGVKFPGDVLELKKKYSALNQESYSKVASGFVKIMESRA